MALISAGLLLYRHRENTFEVFLIHPGGPFWQNKDAGAWSIPKGLLDEGEDGLEAAKRELREETGHEPPPGPFLPLAPITQKGGKTVYAWAAAADFDSTVISSNTFPLEWPPKSGKWVNFPEVDRAGWFAPEAAKGKLLPAQWPQVEALQEILQNKPA